MAPAGFLVPKVQGPCKGDFDAGAPSRLGTAMSVPWAVMASFTTKAPSRVDTGEAMGTPLGRFSLPGLGDRGPSATCVPHTCG